MQTIKGEITNLTFKAADFTIIKVLKDGKKVTVRGSMPDIDKKSIGLEYEFKGRWRIHRTYGRYFDADDYKLITNEIYFFLVQFTKGIGKKTAKLLLNHYSAEEIEDIIENNPENLVNIKRIGPKTVEKIKDSWKEFKVLKELNDFFIAHSAKVTQSMLLRIYRAFGADSITLLKENPYIITKLPQIGFKTADPIALSLGIAFDSYQRVSAACRYVMKTEAFESGNTLVPLSRLEKILKELLETPGRFRFKEAEVEAALKKLREQGYYIEKVSESLDRDSNQKPLIDVFATKTVTTSFIQASLIEMVTRNDLLFFEEYDLFGLPEIVNIEIQLLDRIDEINLTARDKMKPNEVKEFIQKFEKTNKFNLSQEQKQFIYQVGLSGKKVLGLAGYAGTGKTTICQAALELLKSSFCNSDEIICCAFTGMASARIRDVTGYQSKTIHSLLKITAEGPKYNKSNPLPYRVVVLDEASMVESRLFKMLVDSIGPNTILLVVGDSAQLPPMGPGFVFGDLIEKNFIESVQLKKIYRQSEDSVLVAFANEIRRGLVPSGSYNKGYKDFEFKHVQPIDSAEIYRLKNRVAKKLDKPEVLRRAREQNNSAILTEILSLARRAKKKHKDPVWDFQVLSPMRSSILGTMNLNKELQEILNPYSPKKSEVQVGDSTVRIGDKVVHLINEDFPVMKIEDFNASNFRFSRDTSVPSRVYNGSLGKVVKIDFNEEKFYVSHADGRVVEYMFQDFGSYLDHAFALTVHKSQGSQYKEVVIPMTTSHWLMLNNQWLYTAVTRAIEKVILVGQKEAYKRACTNKDEIVRKTYLSIQKPRKRFQARIKERSI